VIVVRAACVSFDTCPMPQFVTEFINIRSLADRYIWSTIKTLPATLPEPRYAVRGPSFEVQGFSFMDRCSPATDWRYWESFLIRFTLDYGGLVRWQVSEIVQTRIKNMCFCVSAFYNCESYCSKKNTSN